jgi:hypothetical protein
LAYSSRSVRGDYWLIFRRASRDLWPISAEPTHHPEDVILGDTIEFHYKLLNEIVEELLMWEWNEYRWEPVEDRWVERDQHFTAVSVYRL